MSAPIINESTSIVQVDSSGLQNGQVNLVYLSSTTIPGQLVTVIDATGFTSSPQAILISTVGGAVFSDGSPSTSIRQRFGYLTLHSEVDGSWSPVNAGSFSNPTVANSYRSLDSGIVDTYLAEAAGLVSTAATATRSIVVKSSAALIDTLYTSTFYVNSVSSFLASRPNDYRMTVAGNEYISGPLLVVGAASYRGNISTGGDLFTVGNISSKAGIIYVGGNVTVGGTIRGQRGIQMTVSTMNIFTSSGFARPVTVESTVSVGSFVNSVAISTPLTSGDSINVMSSIIFGADAFQSMRNTPTGLELIGLSATIPSTVNTSWLAASNSLTTSNITLQSFGPASTLQYLTLGASLIVNDTGSLITSSIQAGTGLIRDSINTGSVEVATTYTNQGIVLNPVGTVANMPISFGARSYDISGVWNISSIGTNGDLHAPYTSLSTMTILTHAGSATRLDTKTDTVTQFTTGSVSATAAVYLNGVSNLSAKNVFINTSRGSIMGSRVDTIQGMHCSSLVADNISTGTTMKFLSPIRATLQDTFISTVTSGTMCTSSLFTTQIATGYPEYYSTINPSTPWLLTSSFNQSGDPFMKVTGLGTYFDKASFLASMNQTTYYSVVNPDAQQQIFLSSPYINSIAGTGTPGTSFSGQVAQFARLGTQLSKAATDSSGTTYIGTKDLGWKIQKIDSAGKISTVAGNYRYFYGDGGDPIGAAFGPRLAVSVSPQSKVVITDISNVRIRILAPGNIVQTIAGTGGSSYSGDGGLAYLATFSTPTATATDTSGNIFIADSYNQVIRKITGSTITTFGGTAGLVGNTGDGGAALAATLTTPFGIAADSLNNIYFTDLSGCAIRRITPQGAISLIAGTYTPGFSGDGGPAIAATLSSPRGIALDTNKNIYFCDTGNSRVRRIDAITGIIDTVAGNGVEAYGGDNGLAVNARLSTPTGVATDGTGNVYLADTNNQCIRFIDMTTSKITTVAGIPTQKGYSGDYSFPKFARLNSPSHVAFDLNTGYYYFADDSNARIRYVDPSINIINTVAGNGSPLYKGDGLNASGAIFASIKSLTCDSANRLYIVDDLANVIRVIDLASGIISNLAGTGVAGFSGDGGPALLANLSSPQEVVVDSNANIYFTERDNQRVRQITTAGQLSTIAGTGVAGYNGDSISSIYATLNNPTALAIDPANGTLYIGDLNNNRIRAVTASRSIETYAGGGDYGAPTQGASFASTMLASTTSIAVDSNSQVYFTEVVTNGLWKLNRATNTVEPMNVTSPGAYLGDSGPLSNAYLSTPVGLTTDSIGNFVIADQGSSHLRRTYTFGYPQTPVYLTMNFAYTNYFASTGTTSIALNGNPLVTFYGSNFSNGSYALSNANVFDYPLQYVNPVYQDTTPFVEITHTDSYGYTKLDGTLFVQEVPSQGLLENMVNSNAGIIMNSGVINFPYQADGITIDNRFNDVSTRSIFYGGQLLTASDPLLKEEIEAADLARCYSTMLRVPLKRYKYTDAYTSTFRVKDVHRLGFLTTDVAPAFPNSVTTLRSEEHAWISSRSGLDTAQLKYNHYGVTRHLMGLVSTLESEVEYVARSIVAQRNTIL